MGRGLPSDRDGRPGGRHTEPVRVGASLAPRSRRHGLVLLGPSRRTRRRAGAHGLQAGLILVRVRAPLATGLRRTAAAACPSRVGFRRGCLVVNLRLYDLEKMSLLSMIGKRCNSLECSTEQIPIRKVNASSGHVDTCAIGHVCHGKHAAHHGHGVRSSECRSGWSAHDGPGPANPARSPSRSQDIWHRLGADTENSKQGGRGGTVACCSGP